MNAEKKEKKNYTKKKKKKIGDSYQGGKIMWRMNEKGQGGIVGAVIGLLVATIIIYMYFVIITPINDLLLPQLGNASNGATLLVIYGLIPLAMIAGLFISFWIKLTSSRPPGYPPQY